MASAEGEEYAARGLWSTRGMHRLAIGGGGAGFEGTLLGGFGGGIRIPVQRLHGPVVRAGLFGYVRGNDAYYESLLELPEVQVGYQYLRARTLLEVGARTGAVLIGRNRSGDTATRQLGSGFDYGLYGAIQTAWFRLAIRADSLPTSDSIGTRVRVAEGTACALLAPLAICADAKASIADAAEMLGGATSEIRVVQGGLVVGFVEGS